MRALQDITGRVDPRAIWTDEPVAVTMLAHNLQGCLPNPLDNWVYSFYPLYRS